MKSCSVTYTLPSGKQVFCPLQEGHAGIHPWPLPDDWIEELAAAGTQYDGHVTNGSLAAQIAVVERLLDKAHAEVTTLPLGVTFTPYPNGWPAYNIVHKWHNEPSFTFRVPLQPLEVQKPDWLEMVKECIRFKWLFGRKA